MKIARTAIGAALSAAVFACHRSEPPSGVAAPRQAICLTDSVQGERYREHLEWIVGRTPDSLSTVTWTRAPDICAAANRAVARENPNHAISERPQLFAYELRGAGTVRYILLWPPLPTSEWATSCWYDKDWKQLGVCVGI